MEFETSVPLCDFPPRWQTRISNYGSWLDALTSGELEPFTLEQKLFLLAVECRTRCSFDPVLQGWIVLSNLNSLITACCEEYCCNPEDLQSVHHWDREGLSCNEPMGLDSVEDLIVSFSCTSVWSGPAELLARARLQPSASMDGLGAVASIPELNSLYDVPELLETVERIVGTIDSHKRAVEGVDISDLPSIQNRAPDIIDWIDMWSEFLQLRSNRRYEVVIENHRGEERVEVWDSEEDYKEYERGVSEAAERENDLISDMMYGRRENPDGNTCLGGGDSYDYYRDQWEDDRPEPGNFI